MFGFSPVRCHSLSVWVRRANVSVTVVNCIAVRAKERSSLNEPYTAMDEVPPHKRNESVASASLSDPNAFTEMKTTAATTHTVAPIPESRCTRSSADGDADRSVVKKAARGSGGPAPRARGRTNAEAAEGLFASHFLSGDAPASSPSFAVPLWPLPAGPQMVRCGPSGVLAPAVFSHLCRGEWHFMPPLAAPFLLPHHLNLLVLGRGYRGW